MAWNASRHHRVDILAALANASTIGRMLFGVKIPLRERLRAPQNFSWTSSATRFSTL